MKLLNWGIPTRGTETKPGDLVSSRIDDSKILGLHVRDDIGDAVLIFSGWAPDGERAPLLMSASAMDAPLSRVEAKLAIKPTDERTAFTSTAVYPMKVGQLLVMPDGDFGVVTLFQGSRVAFSLQSGLSIPRMSDADRYDAWSLMALLPEMREPVEIFSPS